MFLLQKNITTEHVAVILNSSFSRSKFNFSKPCDNLPLLGHFQDTKILLEELNHELYVLLQRKSANKEDNIGYTFVPIF